MDRGLLLFINKFSISVRVREDESARRDSDHKWACNCLMRLQIDFSDRSQHQSILEIAPFEGQLWFVTGERSQVMKTQIHRKVLVIAATAMIGIAATGSAAHARGGGHMGGGFHGGAPYMGGTISSPPIFNPSSGYTLPTSPEAPVSPASPGSLFH
jgi:hypothetical protein